MIDKITAYFGADSTAFDRTLTKMKGSIRSLGDTLENTKKGFAKIDLPEVGKLLGLGALVAGFSAALTKAQNLREEARGLGTDLDPAVARTAELADTLDTFKSNLTSFGVSVIGAVQKGVDMAVAGGAALFGMGSYGENMEAISDGRKADEDAARAAKKKEADAKKAKDDEKELLRLREQRQKLESEAEFKNKSGSQQYDQLQGELYQVEKALAIVKVEKEKEDLLIKQIELTGKIKELRSALDKASEDSEKKRLENLTREKKLREDMADRQQKKLQELEELERSRAEARMTDEQKYQDIIKRGRDAQKRVEENPGDVDAQIGREKIRKEYEDFMRGRKVDNKEKAYDVDSAIDSMKGADGKIRNKDGRIVSEEDRKRSIADKLRNQKLEDESSRKGRIGNDQKRTPKTEAEYLKEIAEALKMKDTEK
jgi:hypothetical protein